MRNIGYFCIVKRFTIYLKYVVVLTFVLLSTLKVNAQIDSTLLKSMDSVRISLLTCGPGNRVYSYYGHTALHYQDVARQQDIVINYGMFSFQKSFFVLRFIFGLTDYEMGLEDLSTFIQQYSLRGSWVKEQILNLTREEKWAITQAIDRNYQPENRVYRYNYFYDNCTTRARDMVVTHINGSVLYPENKLINTSYREMIHQWNTPYRWARFGNDLLLGVYADAKTSNQQQQFLPDSLRADFDNAIIIDKQGHQRPLVDSTFYLIPPTIKVIEKTSIPPLLCAILWFFLTVIIIAFEWKYKQIIWLYDAFAMFVMGIAGIILLAMIFSQHPTVQLNFQILLLCPLHLIFLYPVIKQLRQQQLHIYIIFYTILLYLFLLLSFLQQYAEGMLIMALSLLLRYHWLVFYTHKIKTK